MKVTEHLNEAYTPDELTKVFKFLCGYSSNLYLYALFTYGTLLRPHREIRLVQRKDFDESLRFILLLGSAVKNGKIRKIPIPDYIRQELTKRQIQELDPGDYIFTTSPEPFNEDYFKTTWSWAKAQMMKHRLIREDQTLYSFRHSAAIYSYENQQNLKLLQGLMGHGSPQATLRYLRSLGITEASSRMTCLNFLVIFSSWL